MKVLSLFNGISCGRLALERAGIKVDRYVSYEIDKYANSIAKFHYPNDEYCGGATNVKYASGRYYKLSPVECERLQTLPDNYTLAGGNISNTQRYKVTGNGWTVDVIAHILSHLPKENTITKLKTAVMNLLELI